MEGLLGQRARCRGACARGELQPAWAHHRALSSSKTVRPSIFGDVRVPSRCGRQGSIDATMVLREMSRTGTRDIPADAPAGFIRKRWAEYVFRPEDVDRRFYEVCAMADLKNALRSGDVSVIGSRQFRDFQDYLMAKAEFHDRLDREPPRSSCRDLFPNVFCRPARNSASGTQPDSSACRRRGTPGCGVDRGRAQDQPHRRQCPSSSGGCSCCSLQVESSHQDYGPADGGRPVDGLHPSLPSSETNEPAKDPALLLTALLADATNLGLRKMAESCPRQAWPGSPGLSPGTSAMKPNRRRSHKKSG